MLGVLWSLAVAVAVMVAGDGVSAQGARAHLQHVSVADVNGTGTRHVCFSRQEANLYVLVAEAIDREEVAVGSILDVDGLEEAVGSILDVDGLEEAVGRIRDGGVVNEDGTITYEGQPPIWYDRYYPYYVTPFGYSSWGRGYYPYLLGGYATPFVAVPGGVDDSLGQAVRGQGYTRVSPRATTGTTTPTVPSGVSSGGTVTRRG